jgi:hypothetical protein
MELNDNFHPVLKFKKKLHTGCLTTTISIAPLSMSILLAIPEKKPPKNDIIYNKFGLDSFWSNVDWMNCTKIKK